MPIKRNIVIMGLLLLTTLVTSDILEAEPQQNIIETYSPSSYTRCINTRCSSTFYSEIKYVNDRGVWKDITTLKSLKGLLNLTIEMDANFPVEIIDYNYTNIDITLKMTNITKGTNIPLKVIDKETKEITSTTTIKSAIDINNSLRLSDYNKTILDFYIKYGYNSTNITLQTTGTDNMADAHVNEASATTNYGTNNRMEAQLSSSVGNQEDFIIRWNLSSIPAGSTILNAIASFSVYENLLDTDSEGYNISSHRVYANTTWSEAAITWNKRPVITSNYSATKSDDINITNATSGWKSWNVTSILVSAISANEKNVSIYFLTHDYYGTPATTNDNVAFRSRDFATASLRPMLNITYDVPTNIVVTNATLNLTSEGSCTNWQTNYSNPCNTTDGTPTITFDTNIAGNCSIRNVSHSYAESYKCQNTGSTSHVCNIYYSDRLSFGANNMYIGCIDSFGLTNITTTALVANMTAGTPTGTGLVSCISVVGTNCAAVINGNCAAIYQVGG